ncbi:MAG: DUF58 domain-containing protein [Spirochaetales bacterium]|nr:DUF58 domain-containing protein [Spirochaetales bacterium]
MNKSYPLRLRALSIYLFATFIAFLAGTYFDPFLYMLFVTLSLFPVFSFIILVLAYSFLKYVQKFSTEHPVKGETVNYTVSFTNEFIVPFPCVNIKFKTITPLMDVNLPDFKFYLKSGGMFSRTFDIDCPFRGIYTVGLKEVVVEDILHFFRFRMKVWHKTFYVYPRVLHLERFKPGLEDIEGGDKGLPFGGEPDYAMFDQLKEYRSGEPIKHIYWKKFAIIGKPFIKQFETSPQPAVRIFFDLIRPVNQKINELEVEDTSVEILVALVKFFLDKAIKTSIIAPGREFYNFEGKDGADFGQFYESTTGLIFQDTIPLARLYKIQEQEQKIDSNSIFFITHNLDLDLFNLIEASLGTGIIFTVVFNQSGFIPEQKEKNMDFFYSLKNRGARIIVVNSSKTIIEDLEMEYHG